MEMPGPPFLQHRMLATSVRAWQRRVDESQPLMAKYPCVTDGGGDVGGGGGDDGGEGDGDDGGEGGGGESGDGRGGGDDGGGDGGEYGSEQLSELQM